MVLHHEELSADQAGAGLEIGLGVAGLLKMTIELPAQAEINRQLGTYLPVVLEVRRIVIEGSIRPGDILRVNLTGPARVVNSVRTVAAMGVNRA